MSDLCEINVPTSKKILVVEICFNYNFQLERSSGDNLVAFNQPVNSVKKVWLHSSVPTWLPPFVLYTTQPGLHQML